MDYLLFVPWKCPICEKEYNEKPAVRCSACGRYTEPEHLWEYWDQTDPRYTDKKLEQFAREATKYLLKPDYQKAKMVYNVRVGVLATEGSNWGFFVPRGESEKQIPNTIYYRLPTLRNKKQCAHNVAHESAHASPECWDVRIKHWKKPMENYRGGHHAIQYRKLWEYKEKLRTQYPDYCSD